MAIGYLCPCCGEKLAARPSLNDDKDAFSFCQPCVNNNNNKLPDKSVYTISLETPVVTLDARSAFELLTPKEQQYAYALSQADWQGAKICLFQCSSESPVIFSLLHLALSAQALSVLKATAVSRGLSEQEVKQALLYAAAFYGNLGNYKSFGDTKFVPDLSPNKMETFLKCSQADATKLNALWEEAAARMYSLTPRQRQMGLGSSKGISTYFSANCTEADAQLANRCLDSIGVSAYNTRLFKTSDTTYQIRLASATTDPYSAGPAEHVFEGRTFTLTRGDYAPIMARVVAALQGAIPHAANVAQTKMLEQYIESFQSGSHPAHKEASRHWIQDKGPAVESYIGFIESYRDPSGVRGEWEGFVACVNKEVSRKLQVLVDKAESFLELMPWPKTFEKDKFLRPDFTSLEVLSFGSSGVPAGINIPNYDDIRQSEGFKNVSLGNVLQASYSVAADKKVSFVGKADQSNYKTLKGRAFEVQVGIHELLGHGSGKLFHKGTPDAEQLVESGFQHPVTGEPVTGPFYAKGATWGSTFGKISPTYEECRAECCGLFLCLEPEILEVFGIEDAPDTATGTEIHDVTYINWLLMARAGLTGLEFYTPATKEWRQAHMQARFVILRLLLEAENGELCSLNFLTGDDGKPDVEVVLNRELISTVGRKVVGDFLLKLQVYKSLGDVENGSKFYGNYGDVSPGMAMIREVIMARKEPRKLLVQPHLEKKVDGSIEYNSFPSTPEGMIESFVARFEAEDTELMAL